MPSVGRLRYLEATAPVGTRPRGTLLLLHAFPVNARMWEPQMELARNGWRIIAPQFRGLDGAIGDPPTQSMDDYAGDVIDLLDALHIEDAVVGGVSMGGYAAFAIYRYAPNYVRGLILADTRAEADTPEGIEGRKRMLALVAQRGAAAIADEMVPKLLGETTRRERPETIDRVREMVLANSAESIAGAVRALMTRSDSTPLLASIHLPVLVVVGSEDTITPPKLSEQLHASIAGSQLVVIPEAGHLSNLERPAQFNAAAADFLERRI